MKWWVLLCTLYIFGGVGSIPASLLYDYDVPQAINLPRGDDISSEEIVLKEPVIFFGINFETVYVNVNGFLSFQTDIPQFINIEFPLDYPIIAPFYTNVDTTRAGRILYYQTDSPSLIQRATENVHEAFVDHGDFQATNLLIITWEGVGYHKQGQDKVNTYQVVLITDGIETYVEFLYPENGLQWIQGTGDESGLPDARAQAGIISPDGKLFTLPGSGTEQVRNLEKWSNIDLEGQFIYKVDELEIVEPDNDFGNKPSTTPKTCADASTFCHVQGQCVDYEEGFCCKCNQNYYGNGRNCVKRDLPLRVNGKVHGKINGEKLEGLDLQSYIVMSDGRAYTAISKIPESIGYDIQSLQVLGGVIGFLFAKPIRNAINGYQLTGGVFNHTATVRFLNTSQMVHIKEKFLGLDVFDQLRLEIDIQGDIPNLPDESRVTIDEYQEQYTLTNPGVIQMTSQKVLRYNTPLGNEVSQFYTVDQTFIFDYCKYENQSLGETWKLKVGKNFISYESREQIIRFGLSNKIVPLGDFDPCEEGRSRCGENSACVVENESYRCVCNPGFQQFSSQDGRIACGDTNECQSGQHECDYNAQCVNNLGSYSCVCNAGFEGNGFVCENSRSCFNVTCNENAECVEAEGVASCRCLRGFTGNGHYCNPILDHSCHVANNCSPYGYCAINPETNNYFCACLPGFIGDGYRCTEIETTTAAFVALTETETEPIVTTQRTVQTCLLGVCWCPSGYILLKGTQYCVIHEGSTLPPETNTVTEIPDQTCDVANNCHRNGSCVYSDVTHEYICVCNSGFEGDGYTCDAERVSCAVEYNCHQNANCLYDDRLGRSKCVCNPGYAGDGFTCVIIAICTSDQDCALNEDCRLTSTQRYECVCKDGYARDSQHHCVAVKGSCGGGTCVQNAECLYDDSYQIYYCSCTPGFVGDGIVECKEKIVGCDTLNNCGEHATCRYNEETLSYKCECNEGFFGDGTSCYAERNCHTDPKMCDPNASCLTDASRRFRCQCNTGYVGNGEVCREISQHEGNFLLVNQGMATLKIPLDVSKTKAKRPIQVRPFQTAVGLDADCLVGRVYWSDISGKAIRSSLFNGSDKVDFIKDGIGSPEGLAIDWVSRNIYWTDSTLDTIEVANLDSKRRRTLFNTGLVNPRGIAVHPQRGKIFWSDWDRNNPKIERANADGTGREVFLQGKGVSLPNSLTIDYETDELCYADAGTKSVECVHLDSKERQTIAVNCSYPFGIAVTDKEIYWSDWISKQIERVDKFNLNRLASLTIPVGGTGNKLFGLVAVPNTCPTLTNVCQHNKNQCPAEHICLPNGYGSRQCLCAYKSDAPNEKTNCIL